MSLCPKQKIGVLLIFFSIIGFLWHLIIKHLRKTQIANAYVAAQIAKNCSRYLGEVLKYPYDKKIFGLHGGYPKIIDILMYVLNFILLTLGLNHSFGWTLLISLIISIIIYLILIVINKKYKLFF